MIYEVWTEGYNNSGYSNNAIFFGKFEGDTFKDSVIAFKNQLKDKELSDLINIDTMTMYGCRFFDNEIDARKNFG